MGLGWKELLIVLVIVLVVFGAKKLRTLGSDLGEGVKGFKKGMRDDDDKPAAPPSQLPDASRRDDTAEQRDRDRHDGP